VEPLLIRKAPWPPPLHWLVNDNVASPNALTDAESTQVTAAQNFLFIVGLPCCKECSN
jgi:hypothetical protein